MPRARVPEPLISKEEIRKYYDDLAPRLENYRKRNAYYYLQLGIILRSHIPEGQRVLDLGCGTGDFLSLLRPSYGVGVDLSPAVVEMARKKYPDIHFHVGDIEALTIPEEPFDYIVISNTLGFLGDVQKAFAELHRYAAPDARIVITHYSYLWEPLLKLAEKLGMKTDEPYLNWLSLGDLENMLMLEDFDVLVKGQSVLLPRAVPLLSALCNRYLVRLPGVWRLGLVEVVVARPRPRLRSDDKPGCSVVVPVRNEKGTLDDLVRRLPAMGSSTEVIFVEGHSTDGTQEELRRIREAYPERNIRLLTQDGEGKADAVRKGFAHATGDILMILDGDLSVQPEDLPKFFHAVSTGKAELAIGCRLVYQLQNESMRMLNLLGNKFFSLAFTFLIGQRIKDTLCGTKALRRKHYRRIEEWRRSFGDADPFGDFDLLFGASRTALRIVEIPVRYHARRYGTTQIRRFRHGLLLLKMVWRALWKVKFS